jgi:hypothetical protein
MKTTVHLGLNGLLGLNVASHVGVDQNLDLEYVPYQMVLHQMASTVQEKTLKKKLVMKTHAQVKLFCL